MKISRGPLRPSLVRYWAVVAVLCFAAPPPSTAVLCRVDEAATRAVFDPTSASDTILRVVGNCFLSNPGPTFRYLRQDGAVTQIFLDAPNGGQSGSADYALDIPLGRLPAGLNTIEILYFEPGTPAELEGTLELDVKGPGCRVGRSAGATLLFPYFEVDLDHPGQLTTLVSVVNASAEPALARAVIWSDWGRPLLAFDLYLVGHDVVPINLYDVLVRGQLPQTGGDLSRLSFPDCTAPITLPALGVDELARLRARLTGQPDPDDGLCYAADRGDSATAVGFITVDVLNVCSSEVLYPTDPGYFAAAGAGVARNSNALWGDFVLADPSQDSASGFEAIVLAAAPPSADQAPVSTSEAFYRNPASARPALPSTYQSRFLNGGAFTGGTDLLVWMDCFGNSGLTCGEVAFPFNRLNFRATDEEGHLPDYEILFNLPSLSACVFRLPIDDPSLGIAQQAGLIEVNTLFYNSVIGVPGIGPIQSQVLALLSAEGRFSVGYQATPVGELCR